LKKACKQQIKNKVESEKFKSKLASCLDKKVNKYKKRLAKAQEAADRQNMKSEINKYKEEKAEAKAERNKCKAKCTEVADQATRQNCLDYWNTATREKIQGILDKIGDARERSDNAYCLTDAGISQEETTCKQVASDWCIAINGISKPSRAFRHCRSDCLGACMQNGEDETNPTANCVFDLDAFIASEENAGSGDSE